MIITQFSFINACVYILNKEIYTLCMNKVVLITGATGGMGKATCAFYVEKGYKVFALDRRKDDSLKDVVFVECDVTSEESIKHAFEVIKSSTDHIDTIIHLAGVYMLDSLVEMNEEKFKKIFNINLFGVYRINKIFLPLLSNGSRIIITTSELAPLDPLPFTGIYAISKGALEKYAYSLRMELQLLGIDVTTLQAGAVETPLLGDSTSELEKFVNNTQLYSCNAKNFKNIVDNVEAKAVKPIKVAKKLYKISNKRHTKFAYKLNNNFMLRLLNILPRKMQFFIIKKILK